MRPVLFVAREPDETLRTFLPIIAELRRRGRDCLVLFHHEPGPWAIEQLALLDVPIRRVVLPTAERVGGIAATFRLGSALGELRQLWRAKRLARELVHATDPSVVVVIQDTLLLERFLVREANRKGRGTLVVQWAFTFPQAMYDQLNAIQKSGGRREDELDEHASRGGRSTGPLSGARSQLFRLVLRMLGLGFDLVKSYGGGEAKTFAVMGDVFREQFIAQGVRHKRIVVTGHPLHDAAFSQQQSSSPERTRRLKERYGLPLNSRIVLYATQPVLWRAVVTRSELIENVLALGRAVTSLGLDFLLVLKLHPRESQEDYLEAEQSGLPIRVLPDGEIAELITLADAFISSSSSTVLLAMMLDKPVITVNFNQVPHFDYYEHVGGTLHIKDRVQAAEALRHVLRDDGTRGRLARERVVVLSRFARDDGRATERLASLIEELARR